MLKINPDAATYKVSLIRSAAAVARAEGVYFLGVSAGSWWRVGPEQPGSSVPGTDADWHGMMAMLRLYL